MSMKIDRLQLFLSAAKHLNITRAAREHRISQPAVSQQLKILQNDDLGIILFKNNKTGIKLTEVGCAFYKDALVALLNVEQLEIKYRKLKVEQLTVGASYRPSKYVLPPLMTEFSKKHPAVQLILRTRSSDQIEKLLLESKVDLAITTNSTVSATSFVTERFCCESLTAFVAAKHPLAQKQLVQASEIGASPLIIRFRREGQSKVESRLSNFEKEGIKFKAVVRCETPDVVKEFVRHGAGVGFLYYNSIKRGIQRGEFRAIRLAGLDIIGQNYIVYSKEKPLADLAKEFLVFLRASLTNMPGTDSMISQSRIRNKHTNGAAGDHMLRPKLLSWMVSISPAYWMTLGSLELM